MPDPIPLALNFRWFSDLALFATVAALGLESSLLASTTAVATMAPELAWNADFRVGLLRRGRAPLGLAAYMFDRRLPGRLRGLSLFHAVLPVVLVYLLHRLGYHEPAWRILTPVALGVLAITYLFTAPEKNINWVFGPGQRPQTRIPRPLYLLVVMVFFTLVVYWPTHLALSALFG